MASSQSLISKPSSTFKSILAGFGLMLAVAVGSFSPCYIFFTSMFLFMSTLYFTFISARNPEHCTPSSEEEAVTESVAGQEADKGVFQTQGQEGCGTMHATISENKSTGDEDTNDDDDDDQCITASEDDDNVARSSLSSEDDGSISDEDTLIEIELPTGHYLKQHKLNYSKQKLPDQHRWIELLSEANNELATEEDNFIEIDISVGSVMYPRFEISA